MSDGADLCGICKTPAKVYREPRKNGSWVDCPRCGSFWSGDLFEQELGTDYNPGPISGWIRTQNALSITPKFTKNNFDILDKITVPSFKERLEIFLSIVGKDLKSLADRYVLTWPELTGATYCRDERECRVLLKYLEEKKYITLKNSSPATISITPEGWMYLEEISQKRKLSVQGFVAMWFDPKTQEAFVNGFTPAIRQAGYQPLRIDQKDHINKIDDEIIAEIRRSRFLVADLTGHRSGVYYEAGFAHGLNIPVFYTCHKSDFGNIHFDIQQFNCLEWNDVNLLCDNLAKRISAVLGDGPAIN